MIKILLVIFLAQGDPVTVLSKKTFDNPYQCQSFLDERTDPDLGVFLANLDAKFKQHVHVVVSCVEVDKKGSVVPDV